MSNLMIYILTAFLWLFFAYSLKVGFAGFSRIINNPGKHKPSPWGDEDHSDMHGALSILVTVVAFLFVLPFALFMTYMTIVKVIEFYG
jgi:ammonia channel protein AmtB